MGHELVGSALCGQGRLHVPQGHCDGKSMKLNTKKVVEYKGHETKSGKVARHGR